MLFHPCIYSHWAIFKHNIHNMHIICIYPALVLFEQENCIAIEDTFLLHTCTVTDRNIAFSGTTVTYYLLSFRNLAVNPVHLMLAEKYQKGQSMYNYIILLFNLKYKCRWFIVIFLQDIHNILMQCLKIFKTLH